MHVFATLGAKHRLNYAYFKDNCQQLDKQHNPNSCISNANYIPLAYLVARIERYRLTLGNIDSRWAFLACVGGSPWVRKRF